MDTEFSVSHFKRQYPCNVDLSYVVMPLIAKFQSYGSHFKNKNMTLTKTEINGIN